MPLETAVLEARRRLDRRRTPQLRVVAAPRLRVADVALFYGERSGGIRTYIDAKAAWAQATGAIEHHVIVPGKGATADPRDAARTARHELPSLRLAATNGYRVPIGVGALRATLRALRPDVVLLHDPFWGPLRVARTAHELGAAVVAVHHGSIALDAAGLPGPDRLWHPLLRAWMHHAYREADAVISAVDPRADCGRAAAIELRFGLHPAFVPQPAVQREDHVLYVGRLGREKGVVELLHAAARSRDPWSLRLHGRGPIELRLRRLAENLGLGARVQWRPYIADRAELARAYAAARVVVMPGAHETFGLVGFEAAASGACVVTCATAPSAAHIGGLARTYEPGDVDGLLAAIEDARAAEPDRAGRRRARGALHVGSRVRGRDGAAAAAGAPVACGRGLTGEGRAQRCGGGDAGRARGRRDAACRRGGRPAAQLARGDARRRRALRLSRARRRRATGTCGTGTRAFTRSPGASIDPARARAELRTVLRSGRPDGFLPHTAFWDSPAGWRRAPLYATRGPFGDRCTETIGPPLLAFAWERVADASPDDPGFRSEALARSAPHLRWLEHHRDPDDDGLLTIVVPDESGLDDSPKYVPGLRPAHPRPAGYALLMERGRRARWDSRDAASPATTTTSRTSG